MEDNFSKDIGGGGDGSGGNASDGEQWRAADEALLARLPLTSCCAARFLKGQSTAQGLRTPDTENKLVVTSGKRERERGNIGVGD